MLRRGPWNPGAANRAAATPGQGGVKPELLQSYSVQRRDETDKEVACDLVVTGDDGPPPPARRLEPFGPAAARGSGRYVVVVGLLRDQRLGREDERSDRPGVANRAV